MTENDRKDWRVKLWFLTNSMGWTGLEFAFVEVKDRDHAIAKGIQRAIRLGLTPDKDTRIEATLETSGRV